MHPSDGPNLPLSAREFIHSMTTSNELTVSQMAETAGRDPSTIRRYRSNLRLFGSVAAPPNKNGRLRNLTPINYQCYLSPSKALLSLDKVAMFLWDKFHAGRAMEYLLYS
jgi:hypothetical protein